MSHTASIYWINKILIDSNVKVKNLKTMKLHKSFILSFI